MERRGHAPAVLQVGLGSDTCKADASPLGSLPPGWWQLLPSQGAPATVRTLREALRPGQAEQLGWAPDHMPTVSGAAVPYRCQWSLGFQTQRRPRPNGPRKVGISPKGPSSGRHGEGRAVPAHAPLSTRSATATKTMARKGACMGDRPGAGTCCARSQLRF